MAEVGKLIKVVQLPDLPTEGCPTCSRRCNDSSQPKLQDKQGLSDSVDT